ncbi:MAG: DUF4870 domain-containing protein [Anaerolineae bacterium]|nr:DUF4870 domain-containing protein [Anaerolineae bacterium]
MNEKEIFDVNPEVPESEDVEPQVAPKPAAPEPLPLAGSAPVYNSVPAPRPPQPLSPSDERTWAMLAHLSVLLNLVTGFLGVAAALLIYLIYKDRSRYVAYQSLQAFFFQLIFWAGGGLLIGVTWAIVGALSAIIIGIFLIPVAILLTILFLVMPVLALVYGVIGGIQTSDGDDFRYWLVGDWVRNMA